MLFPYSHLSLKSIRGEMKVRLQAEPALKKTIKKLKPYLVSALDFFNPYLMRRSVPSISYLELESGASKLFLKIDKNDVTINLFKLAKRIAQPLQFDTIAVLKIFRHSRHIYIFISYSTNIYLPD